MADELDKTLPYGSDAPLSTPGEEVAGQVGAAGQATSADQAPERGFPQTPLQEHVEGDAVTEAAVQANATEAMSDVESAADVAAAEATADVAVTTPTMHVAVPESAQDFAPVGPETEATAANPATEPATAEDDHTAPMPAPTVKLPAPTEAPERDQPQIAVEAPHLRDVGATFVQWLRGQADAFASFASAHRLALALAALACVAAVLGMVLLGMDAAKVPPDELIQQDAQAKLAPPSYTVGSYADDSPLVLQSLEIEDKRASGSQRNTFEVEVMATFTNPSMETRAEGLLTYEREGDGWTCVEATVGKASHRATSGVSQQRVLAQVEGLLQEADTADGTDALSALYRDADVQIAREEFDEEAQTDTMVLHCTSSGTFVSYECDLTAHFRFAAASGAWELAGATVSDNARELGFGPLEGTWAGTFASQSSSSAKCLAAREAGLSLTITRAAATDDGGATIEGTVSGVAHVHADLETDASSTDGDLVLDGAPFAGRLSSGDVEQDIIGLLAGNNPKRDTAGIVFDCDVQDVAGGTVALTLTFGQADAPDTATATLTTTHTYRDSLLLVLTYEREARFADSFTLAKTS